MRTSLPELVSPAVADLHEAERLMHAGRFDLASEILQKLVAQSADLQALCLLASSYLELGEQDEALRYASFAVESEPSSAPARDVLAKVHLAMGHYESAMSDYGALATLCREQSPPPPERYSIPAHFALHNVEQLEYVVANGSCDEQALTGIVTEELEGLRRRLSDVIGGAHGAAPWVSVQGRSSRILADPPYVRVPENRLPRYLNADIDGRPMQAVVTGQQKVQVIDEFLTPDALDQVRNFCLKSTVWRRPYKFGYTGAFPQDGFASTSLFAIAEELLAALGQAAHGYQLAQWWGFVYDSHLPGTDIHGDDADFSLNFWITPDSANLDPNTGGMVVWDKTAPDDWSFDDYNSGGNRVRQFLKEQNAESHVIPHRANRAVLFAGQLFHRTDGFTFAPGFANRRRSVTLLFRRTRA
jgi:hypothetical protein